MLHGELAIGSVAAPHTRKAPSAVEEPAVFEEFAAKSPSGGRSSPGNGGAVLEGRQPIERGGGRLMDDSAGRGLGHLSTVEIGSYLPLNTFTVGWRLYA